MKKIMSVILVVLMLFTVMAPAVSAAGDEYLPVIYIRGNGEPLYTADGEILPTEIGDINLSGDDGDIDQDLIVETAVNILKPFVLEGMLFDKWDNYGRAIYDEISPLFPDAGLDGDGNAKNGTGISKAEFENCEQISKSNANFRSGLDYTFRFDWRLSPYDHVDRLNTFIENILDATGKTQVNIWGRCMGGGFLMAYLEKYGHLGYIKNVMFCEVLSNEATVISKAFSGQVEFDAKLAESYLGQLELGGETGDFAGFVLSDIAGEIVYKTMDFFNQVGATDKTLDGVELLYSKLYKALIPALCHAIGMGTQIGYWTCVSEADMDAALDLIFGKEGSELRSNFAGLVDKIQYYRERVTSKLVNYELLDAFAEDGMHLGFMGKYGMMNAPFTKDADLLSDSLVSLEHATFGATCAKIGKTLSDDYIAARVSEGKGRYISADKEVDLSTAYSPDTTWVFKNAHHNMFDSPCQSVLRAFLNGTEETIDTIGVGAQFQVYDYDTDITSPMTEDNCADYEWIHQPVQEPTTETRLASFLRFFTMILNFFTSLFNGTLDFSNIFG